MYPLALIGFDESVCLWFVSVECTIEFETARKTLYESHTFSFSLAELTECGVKVHDLHVWSPVIFFFYAAYHKCIGLDEFPLLSGHLSLTWNPHSMQFEWDSRKLANDGGLKRTKACGLMLSMMEELQQGLLLWKYFSLV